MFISFKIQIICGKFMSGQVTLEMIYKEVKQTNERLRLIEDAIEEIVVKALPEVTLSKKKIREIQKSIQEMKKGSCVTIEEINTSAQSATVI